MPGLWKILYIGFFAGPIQLGADGAQLVVLYSIVPWIGVMAAGFAFGMVITSKPTRRWTPLPPDRTRAVALFLVLRGFNLYGDPRPWAAAEQGGQPAMPAFLAFLNTTSIRPRSISC